MPFRPVLLRHILPTLAGGVLFAAEPPTVAAVGLCVAQHPASPAEAVPFASMPGTRVALRVSITEGVILGLDRRASRIDRLADDRGTDLTRSPVPVDQDTPRLPPSQPSPTPTAALYEVHGPGLPVPGAAAVRVVGHLRLRIGGGERQERLALPALAPRTPIRIGPATLVVASFGKQDPDDAAWTLAIDGVTNEDAVRSMRFLDAAGKPIVADYFQNLSVQQATGHVQHLYSFAGAAAPAIASVEATYVSEVKDLDVPVDVSATLAPAPMPAVVPTGKSPGRDL